MHVRLTPLQERDLQQVMEWRMRPDITKYMNTDPQLTLEGQQNWYTRIKDDPTQRYWLIHVDGVPSGLMSIVDIDKINGRCSWGYYIANLEVRSLYLALYLEWNLYDYVFEKLGLHKLCNETFVLNAQVVRLHKLCGSKEDGIMREHIYKNGKYYDVSVGSILAEEWFEKRKSISYEHFIFE